jgi:hypothetical protein
MTNTEIAIALATQPRAAFLELEQRPRFWFPLLVSLCASIGLVAWYYAVVDISWLADQMLNMAASNRPMTEAQQAQALKFMTRPILMGYALGGGLLYLLALRAASAVYYLLAGKVVNVQRPFRQWFAFAWWSSLPQVLALVPAIVLMAMSDTTQIDTGTIGPLSLNELFFHRGMSERGYSLFASISLMHPVSWVIAIIGMHTWSKRSWLFSSVMVLLPVVLVYGVWAWYALGSA